MMPITKELYRDALHVYLKYAYPDNDEEYYSHWAWLVSPKDDFFSDQGWHNGIPFPPEVRFGCHCSGNTKLRCYKTGFMFDTNARGDPDDVRAEVKRIKLETETEWRKLGIPVHGDEHLEGDANLGVRRTPSSDRAMGYEPEAAPKSI